jgi:hypothetical protein
MRKLIPAFIALITVATLELPSVAAHSAAPADIVAVGRQSFLVVDAGSDRVGLINIHTGSVKMQRLPFTIESPAIYDDKSGTFRAFGRSHSGGPLVLWSLQDGSGTLTSVKTSATRVEAFVRNPEGRLFARLLDDHNILYVGIVGNRVDTLTKSKSIKVSESSDVVLSGSDIVSSADGTVLVDGTSEKLSVPVSTRNDRLWSEARLRNGWLLTDPITGDIRWSRDGSSWERRPSAGGEAFGAVQPYSIVSTSDGSGAYIVSTVGNVNDRRRLLSRVDAFGTAIPVVEFGRNLGRLVAGPGTIWLVGGATDEPTIRFAAVTSSGIGPIRSVAWPAD